MSGILIASYIFGSVGRRDDDELSDLDILAVVADGAGTVAASAVLDAVPAKLSHLEPSISWYGSERLCEMFMNGELFAWHLHLQTIPMFDPVGYLAELGQPAPYTEAAADIASFMRILEDVPVAVRADRHNAAYEAGLIYVCLRNIGMSASTVLNELPDFSRYSALNLAGMAPCPLTRAEFDMAMLCRMASQRGHAPPSGVTAEWVTDVYQKVAPWLNLLMKKIGA